MALYCIRTIDFKCVPECSILDKLDACSYSFSCLRAIFYYNLDVPSEFILSQPARPCLSFAARTPSSRLVDKRGKGYFGEFV